MNKYDDFDQYMMQTVKVMVPETGLIRRTIK